LIPYSAPSLWYLPSSARAGGAGGAFYTTDLTVANVGSQSANYYLKFLGNNKDGTAGERKDFSLAASRSTTFTDVLNSVFGKDSDYGGIEIGAGESFDLVIVGQTSTPGFGGNFKPAVDSRGEGGRQVPNESDPVQYRAIPIGRRGRHPGGTGRDGAGDEALHVGALRNDTSQSGGPRTGRVGQSQWSATGSFGGHSRRGSGSLRLGNRQRHQRPANSSASVRYCQLGENSRNSEVKPACTGTKNQ